MSENEHPLLQERTCLIQILGMIILNRQDSFCWYDYCTMLSRMESKSRILHDLTQIF
jgi:hypothetical protein